MSIASSSSTPYRHLSRSIKSLTRSRASKFPSQHSRSYAGAATLTENEHENAHLSDYPHRPSSQSHYSSSSQSSQSSRPLTRVIPNTTTAQEASNYLSELLHLPSSHSFPPNFALQILTHKSYRFAHHIRSPSSSSYSNTTSSSTSVNDVLERRGLVSHNARLSFLGRRAIASYLALFVHSALTPGVGRGDLTGLRTGQLKDSVPSFLGGRDLEGKLDALMHVNNLGREVGEAWGVGDVMLWDHAETSRLGGHVKVKGLTVEAIIGGTFTHLGSPAAHAAFHMHVLPHLSRQLREPSLIEAVEKLRKETSQVYGGGVVKA